jgi:hypothetical protein
MIDYRTIRERTVQRTAIELEEVVTIQCDICSATSEAEDFIDLLRAGWKQVELCVNPEQCVFTQIDRDMCPNCFNEFYTIAKKLLKITDEE